MHCRTTTARLTKSRVRTVGILTIVTLSAPMAGRVRGAGESPLNATRVHAMFDLAIPEGGPFSKRSLHCARPTTQHRTARQPATS